MVEDDDHEDAAPAAAAPAPAPLAAPAPAAKRSNAEIIDQWFSTEFPGTVFADTSEKWNSLREKVANLKSLIQE